MIIDFIIYSVSSPQIFIDINRRHGVIVVLHNPRVWFYIKAKRGYTNKKVSSYSNRYVTVFIVIIICVSELVWLFRENID